MNDGSNVFHLLKDTRKVCWMGISLFEAPKVMFLCIFEHFGFPGGTFDFELACGCKFSREG